MLCDLTCSQKKELYFISVLSHRAIQSRPLESALLCDCDLRCMVPFPTNKTHLGHFDCRRVEQWPSWFRVAGSRRTCSVHLPYQRWQRPPEHSPKITGRRPWWLPNILNFRHRSSSRTRLSLKRKEYRALVRLSLKNEKGKRGIRFDGMYSKKTGLTYLQFVIKCNRYPIRLACTPLKIVDFPVCIVSKDRIFDWSFWHGS